MKKLKVSFIALAIVAAAVSSYTTMPKSDPNWFLLQSPTTVATFSTSGVYNNLSTYTSGSSIAPISIESAAASCTSTSADDLVCAVKIVEYAEGVSNQLDAQDLDASGNAFTYSDIVGIKYVQE